MVCAESSFFISNVLDVRRSLVLGLEGVGSERARRETLASGQLEKRKKEKGEAMALRTTVGIQNI